MEGGGPFYIHPDMLQVPPDNLLPALPGVAEVPAVHPKALQMSLVFFPPAIPGVAEMLRVRTAQASGRPLAVTTGPYTIELLSSVPVVPKATRAVAPSRSGGDIIPTPVLLGVPAGYHPQLLATLDIIMWGFSHTRCELSDKKTSYTFASDDTKYQHQLALRTVCLGADAKDEFNVVEIIAKEESGDESPVPFVTLKPSVMPTVTLSGIELPPPVCFRLKSGSGPVYISGQHVALEEDLSFDEEIEEEEEEEEVEEEMESPPKPVKRSAPNKKVGQTKAKMDNQVLGYKDLAAIPKDKAILDIERPDLMIYEPHFNYSALDKIDLPRSRENFVGKEPRDWMEQRSPGSTSVTSLVHGRPSVVSNKSGVQHFHRPESSVSVPHSKHIEDIIIESSKFPAAQPPDPNQPSKIETDYWPCPPSLAVMESEWKKRTSSQRTGKEEDDEYDDSDLTEEMKQLRHLQRKELNKIQSNLGKLILKEEIEKSLPIRRKTRSLPDRTLLHSECLDSDSSHYESYGEEEDDDVKDRAHYIQWTALQTTLKPVAESRICGFLWRKKWLGQWTKQLFVIRNHLLLCYKCAKDLHPLLELSLRGCQVTYKSKHSKKMQHELKVATTSETVVIGFQSCEQAEEWRKVWRPPYSTLIACALLQVIEEVSGSPCFDKEADSSCSVSLEKLVEPSKASHNSAMETKIQKKGFLNILMNCQWQSLWCNIEDGVLKMYKDDTCSDSAQYSIHLHGCEVKPGPDTAQSFRVTISQQSVNMAVLETGSSEDRDNWLHLLLDRSSIPSEECKQSPLDSFAHCDAANPLSGLLSRRFPAPNMYIDDPFQQQSGAKHTEPVYSNTDVLEQMVSL
ncbi:DEMA protein, partial [Polypterus senegalus]